MTINDSNKLLTYYLQLKAGLCLKATEYIFYFVQFFIFLPDDIMLFSPDSDSKASVLTALHPSIFGSCKKSFALFCCHVMH